MFFSSTTPDSGDVIKILIQMSLVLVQGARQRVIRVGRFVGQYAKPRSADTETRNGVTLPVYRGDLVNRAGFNIFKVGDLYYMCFQGVWFMSMSAATRNSTTARTASDEKMRVTVG